jgi:DeoR/GlpR family transcriptional regulator of sugar metabolism
MLPNQRREKMLDLIKEDGHAKVAQLSRIFKVTEVTIRQDLEKIEKEGHIKREHGGAFLKNVESNVKSIKLRNQDNLPEKAAIASMAIQFISDGDTIILDSGSTTTEIAKLIRGYKNLTVITNALNIALILGGDPGINLVVTGGEFKSPTLSLTGQKAADFFINLHVDKLFLATAGISLKSGLTYPSISDIVVKRAMIESADVVYLVADSSKIGKNSFASLGALSLINFLITDSNIKEKDMEIMKEHDVNLIIA